MYTAAVMAAFVYIPLLLARIEYLASCHRHALVVIRPDPPPPLRRHAKLMAGWWALIFSVYFAALILAALVSPVISWALFAALPVTLLCVAVSEFSRERSNRRQPLKQLIAHLHQGGHQVWTIENYAAWPIRAGHGSRLRDELFPRLPTDVDLVALARTRDPALIDFYKKAGLTIWPDHDETSRVMHRPANLKVL